MKIAIEDYVARIANASPAQLVVINYEIVIDYLTLAMNGLIKKEDMKEIDMTLTKARQFLNELRTSLNMEYTVSKYLMRIYLYVDKEICYCLANRNTTHIENAIKAMSSLLESWYELEKQEKEKAPVMENSQQLYAGLTYNRSGELSEYVDIDKNRGYKA